MEEETPVRLSSSSTPPFLLLQPCHRDGRETVVSRSSPPHSVHTITLPRHDEAGHAVRDAGAGCQEGDAHDDVRDAERETDHRHLRGRRRKRSSIL